MATMQELAGAIQTKVEALCTIMKENQLEVPSVNHQEAEFPVLNEKGEQVRSDLLSAITQLERLVLGPFSVIIDAAHQTLDVGLLRTLTHFNIPRLVPEHGSISYRILSSLSGVREDLLRHMIREVICTLGFLAEDTSGQVCHSPASLVWHTNPDMGAAHEFNLECKPQAAFGDAEARAQDPVGADDSICGYSQAFKHEAGEYEPFYKHVARKPENAKNFQATMRLAGAPKRGGIHEILGQFDWTSLQGKTLVDVGGSTGHIAAVIAKAHPDIKVIVQDLPEVVQRATGPDAPQMPENVSFQHHNFFTPQKEMADAYLYRSCFHNWSEASAKKMVEAMMPAFRDRPGTKLFLAERIMPALGSGNLYQETQARQLDAIMMTLFNGRCRDLEELQALIASVEPRLKFKRVVWAQVSTITDPRSHSFLEWEYE